MANIKIQISNTKEQKSSSYALFVEHGKSSERAIKDFADLFWPPLAAYLKEQDFCGQAGKVIMVPVEHNKNLAHLFIVGLGSHDGNFLSIETARRTIGSLIKSMQHYKITNCAFHFPHAAEFGVDAEYFMQEISIAAHMAAYHFDEYITEKARRFDKELTLFWCEPENAQQLTAMQKGIERGSIIAQAVNQTRHWIDLPPVALTPPELAAKAVAIAKKYALEVTVFDEPTIKKMGMGGLAAVSAGSEQDCQLVILEYKAAKKDAQTIALVGKGITFDSGGLSIKPALNMETMKDDMSGAAAVISTMQAIAQLKPNVNVIALAPLSENLPSDKATKPGDIVRFYNGKTAEIKNTDAEGRLILADALSYAVKHYKLDAIIDIATLTGACAHALGPFFTGMMGKHKDLMAKIEKAAQLSGERVWQLPFDDDYKKAITSSVADICNIGQSKYASGAITAGFFLSHFVGDVPWVHLDIAGTAFNVPDISYYERGGATGVGVRLFTHLLMQWE